MKQLFVAIVAMLMCVATSWAQMTIDGRRLAYDKHSESYLLTVPQSAFGNACEFPIVLDDTVAWVVINNKRVDSTVVLPQVGPDVTYTMYISHNKNLTKADLRFTTMPILRLEGTFTDEYALGKVQMTLPEEHETRDYNARIKWAGGTTLYDWIEKHNYHIKFVDDQGEKMDVSFFGLRSDNHWRLDAGIIDMIRFRNKVAHALWADMDSKPYYADKQPSARNYSRGEHVEVFLNDEYMGFFDMTEFLDRKQMKLKKYDDENGVFHGFMWKGKVYSRQTLFRQDSALDNTTDHWAGFDLMYPDIDDVNPTDYSLLSNAIRFVATSDDETFAREVGDYFDLPVLADYYVFLHMMFAIDNTCKNIIWSCYDSAKDKKLTLSVWDLEATVGQHWYDADGLFRAPEIQPENEFETCRFTAMSRNMLFMRLKEIPSFMSRVKSRYWQLRETVFDPDNMVARYKAVLDALEQSGALERERERWTGSPDIAHRPIDFYEEFDYLSDWIRRRVVYLDNNTFAGRPGDVDGDGMINLYDLTSLIDYLLTGRTEGINPDNIDLDGDGSASIDDLSALIDVIVGMNIAY